MSISNVPSPIAAYFAADRLSPEAVAGCFTIEATVTDEGSTHVGLEAIKAWKAAASAKYQYTVEPISLEKDGKFHIVRGRVAGSFPGSPIDLQFRFRLQRGAIASLEITA